MATWRGRETMYAIASAMSAAVRRSIDPKRSRTPSRISGRLCDASSVAVAPGSTSETRTCRAVISFRSDSLNAPTPCLVALYTPLPLRATRPATELMFTTSATRRGLSSAAWRRCGNAAYVQYSNPRRLMRTIRSHSSTGASTTGPSSITPALLMRVSRRPSLPTACAIARSASAWIVTSAVITVDVAPSARSRSASSSSRSVRRATSATRAPRPASETAVASPMPLDAPVTSATVPSRGPLIAAIGRLECHMAMPAALAPATQRLGYRRLAALNAFWFGGGAHWQPISISLLPVGAMLVSARSPELVVGRATAAGGIFAMLVPLVAGYLSDRTSSRWGRRRPWMVIGTAFNVIGLGLLAFAGSPAMVVAAYVFVQASNNAASAAYAGVIPDVVPAAERGRASGLLGTMNQVGTVVGVGLVGVVLAELGSNRRGIVAGYAVIVVIVLASLLISVRAIHEPPSNFRHERSARRTAPTPMMAIAGAAFVICLMAVLTVLVFSIGAVAWVLGGVAAAAGAVAIGAGLRVPVIRQFLLPFADHDFLWVFLTRF